MQFLYIIIFLSFPLIYSFCPFLVDSSLSVAAVRYKKHDVACGHYNPWQKRNELRCPLLIGCHVQAVFVIIWINTSFDNINGLSCFSHICFLSFFVKTQRVTSAYIIHREQHCMRVFWHILFLSDNHEISLIKLNGFKRINELLSPCNHQKNIDFLIISGGQKFISSLKFS